MGDGPIPTFEEWVDYCFRQGYADFHAKYASVRARVERFVLLPVDVLAGYVILEHSLHQHSQLARISMS